MPKGRGLLTCAFSNCFPSLHCRSCAFSAIIPHRLLLLLLSHGRVQMLALLETHRQIPPVGSSLGVSLPGSPGADASPGWARRSAQAFSRWAARGCLAIPSISSVPLSARTPPGLQGCTSGAGTSFAFLGTDVNRDPARRLEIQRKFCRAALSRVPGSSFSKSAA